VRRVLLVLCCAAVTSTIAPAAAGPAPPTYVPPVDAEVVDGFRPPASLYGAGNRGLEYGTEPGTEVRAVAAGRVVFAGSVAGTRAVTVRHVADPGRFHDVRYESLVADPLAEVERLYARVGLQLRDQARRRMTFWLRRHHDRRVSGHRYSLGDFALDRVEVDQRFARYQEWADAHTGSSS